MNDDERRARLGRRHHLAEPAPSPAAVVRDLVALHATDPATVFLAAWARRPSTTIEDVEGLLYEERSVVRLLGMRRTMFVVDADLVGAVDVSCSQALAVAERRRLIEMITAGGASGRRRPERWLASIEEAVLADLAEHGPSAAAELPARVLDLSTKLVVGEGTRFAAEVGLGSRVLLVLAMEGRIVRGRPRGSWLSSQYRWARTEDWLGQAHAQPDPLAASAELARRWLQTFGPAPLADLKWWTGWTLKATKAALAEIDAVPVALDDGEGWVLADDLESVEPPQNWVALLPALDPTAMGWKTRDWYLPPELVPQLFDHSGNIGPTIWADGRIVGGWGQRPDGQVGVRLLVEVDDAVAQAVDERATQLTDWLDGTVVTPRFRTPVDRELRSQV